MCVRAFLRMCGAGLQGLGGSMHEAWPCGARPMPQQGAASCRVCWNRTAIADSMLAAGTALWLCHSALAVPQCLAVRSSLLQSAQEHRAFDLCMSAV